MVQWLPVSVKAWTPPDAVLPQRRSSLLMDSTGPDFGQGPGGMAQCLGPRLGSLEELGTGLEIKEFSSCVSPQAVEEEFLVFALQPGQRAFPVWGGPSAAPPPRG